MTSEKQKKAAKKNIKKAQKKWQSMSKRQHSLAQPEGKDRKKPGTGGEGNYYHIEVRPKEQFTSFRNHDIGRKGHTQRVAGRRSSGSWATQKWLINKKDAYKKGDELKFKDKKAKSLLEKEQIRGPIKHVKGDIFKAKPRKNVPEKDKPTSAQKKARKENIKKAQEARKKSTN
ncbi:hypothetical protein GF354_02845 [Candidatus Peregrinibacteria bacterium]|nr:hypothetical protein [Candidatus Peregrinibacteria bacterium]